MPTECAYCGSDRLLSNCPAHSDEPCSVTYLGDDLNHETALRHAALATHAREVADKSRATGTSGNASELFDKIARAHDAIARGEI